jgi:hypothetical protein
MPETGLNDPDEQLYDSARLYHGKYRGTVLDNLDLLMMGRLMVKVPAVPGSLLNWALPCTPYAGPDVGFFMMPPIGANVWVEFEGGDPNWPIWSGCFWGEGELPGYGNPMTKLIQTSGITMTLSDIPELGGFRLQVTEPSVALPLSMTFTSEGVSITVEDTNVLMTPEAVTVTTAETVVTVSPATVSVLLEPSNVAITEEGITVETPIVEVTGDVDVVGAVEIEGDVEIAGAVEIEGDVEITGAVEIQGAVDVAGIVGIEGGFDLVGAGAVEGAFDIVGALVVEGDVAVAGAQEVAGDVAVAGLIEGIVVPPLL